MPRISAPTVAQHRAAQRAALIQAGQDVILDSGLAAVTPRAVCERAGLARSSFYDYFATKDDLLVAIAIAAIEAWDAELSEAMAVTAPGLPSLRILVYATMSMSADGRHEIAGALRDAQISPSRFEDVMALHDALIRPLVRVLAELEVAEPATAAVLVQGVLGAGIQLVAHGMPHEKVADDVFVLITSGLLRP